MTLPCDDRPYMGEWKCIIKTKINIFGPPEFLRVCALFCCQNEIYFYYKFQTEFPKPKISKKVVTFHKVQNFTFLVFCTQNRNAFDGLILYNIHSFHKAEVPHRLAQLWCEVCIQFHCPKYVMATKSSNNLCNSSQKYPIQIYLNQYLIAGRIV